jgi:hypothetical protein
MTRAGRIGTREGPHAAPAIAIAIARAARRAAGLARPAAAGELGPLLVSSMARL